MPGYSRIVTIQSLRTARRRGLGVDQSRASKIEENRQRHSLWARGSGLGLEKSADDVHALMSCAVVVLRSTQILIFRFESAH